MDAMQRRWLTAIQFAAAGLPEETLLSMGLAQGQLIGLETTESKHLQTLFANYYARVRSWSAFQAVPSALPYCFSQSKPTNGLATVFVPARITGSTRTILFVHGFGGSLLGYLHFMASTFSNDVVICPAYGVEPASISPGYLTEALNACATKLGRVERKPMLIGLSAGGVGACRVFAERGSSYQKLICLGSIPPLEAARRFDSTMEIHFISGAREPHVVDGSFNQQIREIRPRVRALSSQLIPEADHYFLLSHEQQTRTALLKAAGN